MFESSIVVETETETIHCLFNPVYFEKLRKALGITKGKKIMTKSMTYHETASGSRYHFNMGDLETLIIPAGEFFMAEYHKSKPLFVPERSTIKPVHKGPTDEPLTKIPDEISKDAVEHTTHSLTGDDPTPDDSKMGIGHAQKHATDEPGDIKVQDLPDNLKGFEPMIQIAKNMDENLGGFSRTDLTMNLRKEFTMGVDEILENIEFLIKQDVFFMESEKFHVNEDYMVPEIGKEAQVETSVGYSTEPDSVVAIILQGLADREDSDSIMKVIQVDNPSMCRADLNIIIDWLIDEGYCSPEDKTYPELTEKGFEVLEEIAKQPDKPEPEACADCGLVPAPIDRHISDKQIYCGKCFAKLGSPEPEKKSLTDLAEMF